MLMSCEYCFKDILSEANSFAWISTNKGHRLSCMQCVTDSVISLKGMPKLDSDPSDGKYIASIDLT